MMIKQLLIALIIVQLPLKAQEIGTFIDKRDGQAYTTVIYDIRHSKDSVSSMTWMAENLNYRTENSYCYDDFDSNCDIMGRLYSWSSAMKVCPQGWHLPNDEEWYSLANLYGGVEKAGTHLKSSSNLWARGGKGTNKSLFNVMPFGAGTKVGKGTTMGGYYSFGLSTQFWSSSEKNELDAWDWGLHLNRDKISRWEGRKETILNCVRCVQD